MEDVIRLLYSRFRHTPRCARGADSSTFTREGRQKVVREDTAINILLERIAHKGLRAEVVGINAVLINRILRRLLERAKHKARSVDGSGFVRLA